MKFCKRDVPKFCKDIHPGEGEGKILECLKQHYDVCFEDLLFTLNHTPLNCSHEQVFSQEAVVHLLVTLCPCFRTSPC